MWESFTEEEGVQCRGKVLNNVNQVNKGNLEWALKDKSIEEVEKGADSCCWESI